MRTLARSLPVAVAAMLVTASVALAAAPAPPAAGKWRISGGGTLVVGRGRTTVSDLRLPAAAGSCGETGPVKVLGTQKLRTVTRGGVTNWLVGTGPEIGDTVHVTVEAEGRRVPGGLYLIWDVGGYTRDNLGLLTWGTEGCQADLSFTK